MSQVKTLPPRSKVKPSDCWDLSKLFTSESQWEKQFAKWSKQAKGFEKFRGKLHRSSKIIARLMEFDTKVSRMGERLGIYAFLRTSEDQADSKAQRMKGRFQHAASEIGQASSWIRPELLAIPRDKMAAFIKAKELSSWKLALQRILRYRPHTLTKGEEKLLAMQAPMSEASNQIFDQLNDSDLKFGTLRDAQGHVIELGHSSYSAFLISPSRIVRQKAFHQYYAQFEAHKNTFAASLGSSVQRDVYYAKARSYPSVLQSALFDDNVPISVYDNLINSVHKHLPDLYRYYQLRKRKMKLAEIHHYDTYVPILSEMEKHHTWDQAVKTVVDALEPLGDQYCSALHEGMTKGRWCDRYPNRGKDSGAFSSGGFDSPPYILMNFQPKVLDHVFTLAHEAGHSMHTWYSARNQPFQYYGYTIFVAEVASTFNEQLLANHLMKKATSKQERAYLINRQIDGIRGTIIRQTMFAEFEKIMHTQVEGGEPLTVDSLRTTYRKLLELYFGPRFSIDKELELECLRIPHFYRAFYVYKYATGLSAAIALSERVTKGGAKELNDYLGFLKGGCSNWPLELLRGAGVDMEQPLAVNTALKKFGELVSELDELL